MHESRAEISLRETLRLMQPLARLLVADGVTYPQFVRALKTVFLQAAREELRATHAAVTDSALSLLSGVHRKDVRVMRASDAAPPSRSRGSSLAAAVAARWARGAEYRDADGAPRALPLRSRSPGETSFESLVQSVSKDFHARSVLDELVRLGAARIERDCVHLHAAGLEPGGEYAAAAGEAAASVHDHLAAAAANLRAVGAGAAPPFAQPSFVADGLSDVSCESLQRLANELSVDLLGRVGEAARARASQDAALAPALRTRRLRIGTYCFAAPAGTAAAHGDDDAAPGMPAERDLIGAEPVRLDASAAK
jgi:hypothetical protein